MVFKEILVPVDFTVNTDIALKKAIDMLDPENAVINLLHVIGPVSHYRRLLVSSWNTRASNNIDFTLVETNKLRQLRYRIMEQMPANGNVYTSIMKGNVEQCIAQRARELKCDLVILAKHNRQSVLPTFNRVSPNVIARSGNCAVLMAKPGSVDQKIRSIVVPVGNLIPLSKIDLLLGLLNKFHAKVHLVTLRGKSAMMSNNCSQAVLHTYRTLKATRFSLPIVHKELEGKNLANASLKYAQLILADMILVNPDSETRISTFTGKHITDLLLMNSRLQVLEVEP
ncbi:universal stress protein [Flavitalea antarctica]